MASVAIQPPPGTTSDRRSPLCPRPPPRAPHLRALRKARGWTQQEVAERVCQLAIARGESEPGINASMVSKWERGKKGVCPRYRRLLAALYRVPISGLGLPDAGDADGDADEHTLVSMIDSAAELLDQLGGPGRALRAHVLAATTDEVLDRRSLLSTLDTPAPALVADPVLFEDLADRYDAAHATAAPAALMTALNAHLRAVGTAIEKATSTGLRQRLTSNRARVAILAGRVAADGLGNPTAARSFYATAYDDALETGEHQVAAIARGYAAQLATSGGQLIAALEHLRAASALAGNDPSLGSWLATIEATTHAAAGRPDAAYDALRRAHDSHDEAGYRSHSAVRWFHFQDTGCVRLVTDDSPAA